MGRRELKVVKLIEPDLCQECRFANEADVETQDGSKQRMVYCRRLDCDNWDYASAEAAVKVELTGDNDLDQAV
jgi:hypothetical protein